MLYKKITPNRFSPANINAHQPTAQEYINTVKRRLSELKANTWCIDTIGQIAKNLKDKDRQISEIRCLAMGSPSDSQNAQFQLAFLILLSQQLAVFQVTVWDPLFEQVDKEVFGHWSITIQEQMDHRDDLLYYVPHGPRSLNVCLGSHPSLLYLGNDYSNYVPHTKIDPQQQEIIERLGRYHVQSYPISKHDRCFLAMNNLALYVV